ncbi:MAG: trimeric intracellular cation channel family protein [Hydrogenophaga sp.]|uniref:trimeric intracellular cation channel family protein n=1 Tax=Hydrogenophaga sp. TaxID=1904254 RepID=UPI001BB935B6|nr:trimeric intracellular cation channel family protein [Hydrogenophaga sp.]MBS3910247.1 trimeric intracellular cation channel family protein [Hydrogenophaga sp.]MDO9146330.1 trimeric intracellular cation channel family protein [Hydrogenophaga sp.]MDO9604659.1 trimeric intracellular cation channel family protein [Hydrogenophaga sp.]MDP2163939.1 trimeric intracellular cation channel family protein [Hydrogenophaga sp.]MDP3478102.1 trimeric intracellular cation channel family protein [Hydrogenoph
MQNVQFWGETLRLLVEVAGTAAFALAGIMEAARKRLDAVGVCVVGFLTAFGGGTLRDLLLDQRPFFWVRHVEMLWGVLALCVLAMFFLRQRHFDLTERAIQWPDALGLGLFAATGVHQALLLELPGVVAVLMGLITGVFGGVLRDVVCNEIPTAFHDHRPYAVCAFAGGWVYVGLWQVDAPGWLALVACVSVTAGLRGLAVWRNWQLPAWRK